MATGSGMTEARRSELVSLGAKLGAIPCGIVWTQANNSGCGGR